MHFAYAEKIKHPDLHWIKVLADVVTNQVSPFTCHVSLTCDLQVHY